MSAPDRTLAANLGILAVVLAAFLVAAAVAGGGSEPRPVCLISTITTDDPTPKLATCRDADVPGFSLSPTAGVTVP